MAIAEMVGIKVLVAGGIGGVHQSASLMMDISADLGELGRTNVAVVCSGPRPYLDVAGTLEFLETRGVPVTTFRPVPIERREWAGSDLAMSFGSSQMEQGMETGDIPESGQMEGLTKALMGATVTAEVAETMLPAFYSREGRFASPLVIEDAKEAAKIICMSSCPSPRLAPKDFQMPVTAWASSVANYSAIPSHGTSSWTSGPSKRRYESSSRWPGRKTSGIKKTLKTSFLTLGDSALSGVVGPC